jgi:hypothetical protein
MVNYLNALTSYNPDATGGTIVLTQINRSQDVVGSYSLDFSGDILSGTFDAVYCAAGREP